MLHDDLRTPVIKQGKSNLDGHPIDRILTAYFDRNNQLKQSQSNNSYKSETRRIIQRQRVIRSFLHRPDETEPSIRKPITIDTKPKALRITSMSPPHVLFAELNSPPFSLANGRSPNMKKELQRQSTILIRRRPPTLLDYSPPPLFPAPSDITELPRTSISLPIPSHFTFRNPSAYASLSERVPSESAKRANPWKNQREKSWYPKLVQRNHSLPIPKWTPTLFEQDDIHQRALNGLVRSKSQLGKFSFFRPQPTLSSTERVAFNPRHNQVQELFVAPRSFNYSQEETNRKKETEPAIDDEWDESPMIHEDLSDDDDDDEDEFPTADGDSVISRCNSRQYHQSSTRSFSNAKLTSSSSSNSTIDDGRSKAPAVPIKRSPARRRPYNLALPPVAEHDDDEQHGTDLKTILGELLALNQSDGQNEEDSLTFQLLNQQETEFERRLSKLRSVHAKGKS